MAEQTGVAQQMFRAIAEAGINIQMITTSEIKISVLVARHERFHVVMACYYGVFTPRPEQECVCVAHFEGDAQLAALWASGLRRWLERQWQGQGTAPLDAAVWAHAAPAKC